MAAAVLMGMRKILLALTAAVAVAAAGLAFAQETTTPGSTAAYRVQFFLSTETPGSPGANRTYTLRLSPGNNRVAVDTGSQVPIPSGDGTQFRYQNVGVRLECTLLHAGTGAGLEMRLNLGISAVAPDAGNKAPIISTVSASLSTSVPLGRKLTVATFENPETHTHYQLAVEAAPAPER